MNNFFYGYRYEEFEFDGRQAIMVFPNNAEPDGNWLLKTEYWGAFPQVELEMLGKGFCLAYLKNDSRFAAYEDCRRKSEFVKYVSEKYGLKNKCIPVGYSCGGAHAVNFAGFFPECVCCIYIDAPVLNFCDYPGRYGDEECEKVWENEFVKAYPDMTRAKLFDFKYHPINRISVLKENRIPIIMLYGTEDQTVRYSRNGRLLEDEYRDCPELLTVIPRNLQGHHPHGSIEDMSVLTDFLIEKSR